MARSYLLAVVLVVLAVLADSRPLTGSRRLLKDDDEPQRIGNSTFWTLVPEPRESGEFVNLLAFKNQLEKFKVAGGATSSSGSGDSSSSSTNAAAALTAGNPFLEEPESIAPLTNTPSTPAAPTPDVPAPSTPTTPSPAETTPPPAATVGGSCPDPDAALSLTNSVRAANGAAALQWSADLAATAQAWADTCAMAHSGGPVGENLMMGSSVGGCGQSVQGWAAEQAVYVPGGGWQPMAGHFTQLVWKATSQMGCGMSNCGGSGFVVCHYNSPGNVIDQFGANAP